MDFSGFSNDKNTQKTSVETFFSKKNLVEPKTRRVAKTLGICIYFPPTRMTNEKIGKNFTTLQVGQLKTKTEPLTDCAQVFETRTEKRHRSFMEYVESGLHHT